VVADVPSEVKAPPELPAASYLLADLGSGDVLVGKAAHEAHLPASTMKLLTAQTLLPRMDGNLKTRATDSDARVDGTRVGMVPGREYTADQLFHALLMGSANDAAEALARANGGLEQSLKQMSDRAAQLGAKDTVPRSPHGLDAEGQQTSAYDLVAILRGALDTPKVAEILTTQTYPFPKYQPVEQPSSSASASSAETGAPSAAPNGGPSLAGTQQVASQNKLLWNYEGTIGGKDGYTDAAGHTFVGAVRRGDKTYAVAFMGAKSNDWRPMAGLLDWAFANGSKVKAVGKLPGAASPVAAAPAAPTANVAAAEEAPAGGLLAAIVGFFLTVLKVLAWTVAILAVAVVALRVRKLRRDARRRELRRQRLEASLAGVVRPEHPSTPRPLPHRGAGDAAAPARASGPDDADGCPGPAPREGPPTRCRARRRAGLRRGRCGAHGGLDDLGPLRCRFG
jgi:D-alanyl-D-alanine carboxypeptidase (penicillin-binding protein 5/6)